MNNHLKIDEASLKSEKKYKTLRAEVVRNGLTISQFADLIKMNKPTLSNKLNGHYDFTLSECLKIKAALNYNDSMEVLFDVQDNQHN